MKLIQSIKAKIHVLSFFVKGFILFTFSLFSFPCIATHIVGGELFYEHLGNNEYLVTLIVYRDCGPENTLGTGFDDNAIVGIFNNGSTINSLSIPLVNTLVSEVPVVLENPCFIPPPELCIEKAIFSEVTTLPPISGGYDLVYQRCCRNAGIVNLQFPDDTGMTMWAHVPGEETIAEGINNSAVFASTPAVAMCLGAEFFFDHSATDADGDQLSYSLCAPFFGGTPDDPAPFPSSPDFTEVLWANGYNEDVQIASDPNFQIDPLTGQLTGTPTQIGRYAVGICVSEYRNGQLLCSTMRDFQFQVTACDPTIIAAIPDQEQFCDGLSFQFTNESFNASSFLWDFGVPFSTVDTSTAISPAFTYPFEGTFDVTLIANPSWPCADTSVTTYQAFPSLEAEIENVEFTCAEGVPEYIFTGADDYDFPFSVNWDFPAAFNITNSSDEVVQQSAPTPGTYTMTYTVVENGCEDQVEYTLEVPEPPLAVLEPQELFCNGFTFDFINGSINAQDYEWDFGVDNITTDVSNLFEPSYTYPDSGQYTVTLRAYAPGTCPSLDFETFEIKGLLAPYFDEVPSQCFDGHSFDFEASGFDSETPAIDWEFGLTASPITSDVLSVNNVTWSEPGTYLVSLAITENNCTKVFSRNVEIIPNPIPDFNIFSSQGCPPLSVTLINSSQSDVPLTYLWDFGDGSTSTLISPSHDYNLSGIFDISLTISSSSGCVGDSTYVIEDAIQVYPVPTAGFETDAFVVNFLTPTINLTDLSSGGTSCFYDFGDGNFSIECSPTHEFEDVGYLNVTQTVTNDFGCEDTHEIPITVEGHFFYAPNSFTPNNDLVNDIFLPSVIGVTEYRCQIFNRWGEIIFETTDDKKGWDGSDQNGDYYAPNGIYAYKIVVNDLTGFPHEYDGHVSLIR